MTSTARSIVSDGLDMIQYPVGAGTSANTGDHIADDHIMGVVALAWCTDDALDRWGEPWARHGSIEMRFRSHLTARLDLAIASEHHSDRSDISIASIHTARCAGPGADGITYATGTLRPGPTTPFELSGRMPVEPFPVPPHAELLDGYELHPVHFEHVAERDLHLVDRLAHRDFWRERGWAHPAWLASAANAIVRHNVDFEAGGYWRHAGIRVDLHQPVSDGARLVASGRVVELFERSTHRFMVCDVSIVANGHQAASIRSTSVYGAAHA